MREKKSLCYLEKGQRGRIGCLEAAGSIRRRLQELGMIPGTWVECVGKSPLGDPKAYLVRGTVLALRRQDAEQIWLWAGEAQEGASPGRAGEASCRASEEKALWG